jgi:gamma-glutamyltranspeptidase/glutathione hydrolase
MDGRDCSAKDMTLECSQTFEKPHNQISGHSMTPPSKKMMSFVVLLLLLLSSTQTVNGDQRTRDMVVTPHPLATATGQEILEMGGTAADAMVAVQTVLGLVEPQSSGLGGGAFCVYYDAETGDSTSLDGRETAPAAATEDRFASLDNFLVAWQSGLSVGVPGVPRLLQHLHDKFGQLPWKGLFEPAQTLATNGVEISERTSATVSTLLDYNTNVLGFENCSERLLFRDPTAFSYFVDESTCTAKAAGTQVTNEAYYETLVSLANEGANAFYSGPIAADIVAAVQGDLNIPGDMTREDLADYKVVEREPVCIDYRNHSICGMGPPSSGGLAVSQMLGMLETFDLSVLEDPLNEEAVHLFTQVGRLAFSDRNMFVADSDFINVPVDGMLNKAYLATRADLIGETDMGLASAGVPPGVITNETAADSRTKQTGTSHISIIDQYGNALSFTSSIEAPFGNGVMVGGFLLNNQLTDFSFIPSADGTPIANRVQGNKRPRSSMSPTIVFNNDGNVKLLTGSVGGSTIIGHTAQSIMNILDFGLDDPQEAVEVPHYQNNNEDSTLIETPVPNVTRDYNATALAEALTARGHVVEEQDISSGLAVILVKNDGVMVGGADKRRDVTVGGSDLNMPDDTSSGSALNSWIRMLPVVGAWLMLALL